MVIRNYIKLVSEYSVPVVRDIHVYETLGFLGIFFMPFDSFPWFPIPTSNRPVWVLPFVLLFFYDALLRRRVEKFVILLLATVLYMIGKSFVLYEVYDYPAYTGLIKGTLIFFLLIPTVGGISIYIRRLQQQHGQKKYLAHLAKVVFLSSLVPIFIGLLQIAGIFNVPILDPLSRILTEVFSYRYSAANRIQLVNGEPAWASAYLIFIFFFLHFYYRGKNKKLILSVIALLFVFAASTIGFLYGLTLASLYLLMFVKLKYLARAFLFLIITALLSFKLFDVLPIYTQVKIKMVINLVSNLSVDQVLILAARDASFLTRFVNPIIGFKLGFSSFFFGIGMEAFQYRIIEELVSVLGEISPERQATLLKAGGTPKFLFSKVFCELGLLAFLALLSLYVFLMVRLFRNKQVLFMLVLSIVISYNYDSYLFYAPLLLLLVAASVIKKIDTSNE